MGSYDIADGILQVYRTLRDVGDLAEQQKLTDTEIGTFLAQATRRYAMDRPLVTVEDSTSVGTVDVPLPTAWEDGFSVMLRVEYPISTTGTIYLVDQRSWSIYRAPGGPSLRFSSAITTGEDVRCTFTTSPTLDAVAANSTLPDADFLNVCDLAVSISADAIANGYGFTHDPVIATDVTNYRTKVDEWQSIAKRYERRYQDAMRITTAQGASAIPVAGTWINWDLGSSDGKPRLTHDARYR